MLYSGCSTVVRYGTEPWCHNPMHNRSAESFQPFSGHFEWYLVTWLVCIQPAGPGPNSIQLYFIFTFELHSLLLIYMLVQCNYTLQLVHQLSSIAPPLLLSILLLFYHSGRCLEFAHGYYTSRKQSLVWPTAVCQWLPPPGLGMMLNTKREWQVPKIKARQS